MSLTLTQIDQGIEALIKNAEDLITEARLLLSVKSIPRAYTLSHLAREELSRVVMLEAAALRVLANRPVNWKKLMKRLRDHKAKLMLENSESGLQLMAAGMPATTDAYLGLVAAGASIRNDWKNSSIYVNFEDGKFLLPSNQISDRKAERSILLAGERLSSIKKKQSVFGEFSKREIGSLSHMPDIDKLVAEDLESLIEAAVKLIPMIEEKLVLRK